MNNIKRKNIVHVIEFIICLITVAAVILLMLSFVAMVEEMSVSPESFYIFVSCLAWLALVGLYTYLVNR